jgi:intracellular multiplication protein IcmV
MAVRDALKVTRKTFFNPLGWLGYKELKTYNKIIFANIKDLATVEKPERKETFEEAMERFEVTDADVKRISERYLLYAIFFVIVAAFTFAGAFVFLIGYGKFSGFMLALACTTILLCYAFRFHFWHFQIKHRKLGCTFADWWSGTPRTDKDAT